METFSNNLSLREGFRLSLFLNTLPSLYFPDNLTEYVVEIHPIKIDHRFYFYSLQVENYEQ